MKNPAISTRTQAKHSGQGREVKRLISALIMLFAGIVFSAPGAALAKAAPSSGSGVVLEFKALGLEILRSLDEADRFSQFFPEVPREKFKEALATTRIQVRNTLRNAKGESRDALNFPARKLIMVARSDWNELDVKAKRLLVFHEYLGIMGLEGSDEYSISLRLDEALSGVPWRCYVHCGMWSDVYPSDVGRTVDSVEIGAPWTVVAVPYSNERGEKLGDLIFMHRPVYASSFKSPIMALMRAFDACFGQSAIPYTHYDFRPWDGTGHLRGTSGHIANFAWSNDRAMAGCSRGH